MWEFCKVGLSPWVSFLLDFHRKDAKMLKLTKSSYSMIGQNRASFRRGKDQSESALNIMYNTHILSNRISIYQTFVLFADTTGRVL